MIKKEKLCKKLVEDTNVSKEVLAVIKFFSVIYHSVEKKKGDVAIVHYCPMVVMRLKILFGPKDQPLF